MNILKVSRGEGQLAARGSRVRGAGRSCAHRLVGQRQRGSFMWREMSQGRMFCFDYRFIFHTNSSGHAQTRMVSCLPSNTTSSF